jgi:hypothetical protein
MHLDPTPPFGHCRRVLCCAWLRASFSLVVVDVTSCEVR